MYIEYQVNQLPRPSGRGSRIYLVEEVIREGKMENRENGK